MGYSLEYDFELFPIDKSGKLDGRFVMPVRIKDASLSVLTCGGDINKINLTDYPLAIGDKFKNVKFISKNFRTKFKFGSVSMAFDNSDLDFIEEIPGDRILSDKGYDFDRIGTLLEENITKYIELYIKGEIVFDNKPLSPYNPFELFDVPGFSLNSLDDVTRNRSRVQRNTVAIEGKSKKEEGKILKDEILQYIYSRYLLQGEREFSLFDIYSEFSSSYEEGINEIQSALEDLMAEGFLRQLSVGDRLVPYLKIN
ncbi:MAG: hypothetical protein QXI33_02045 [Candidatus Pacearchaeota archaeon]